MKQHILFALDKSGSMEVIRDRVISGFNEFLEDQKREASRRGDEVSLTLTLFDSPVYSNVLGQVGYVTAYAGEKIEDVPGLTKEATCPVARRRCSTRSSTRSKRSGTAGERIGS